MISFFYFTEPQSQERLSFHGNDLESNSRNITDGMSFSAESSHGDFVILVQEVKATVFGDESGYFLSSLLQKHSDTLSHGGVGLLGFAKL